MLLLRNNLFLHGTIVNVVGLLLAHLTFSDPIFSWALFQAFVKILPELFEVHVSCFFADPVTLFSHEGNGIKLLLCLGWHDA